MIIYIKRTLTKHPWTEGRLLIDGIQVCDTLENSNACVPAGVYPVTLIKCKQYARKMPILAVPELVAEPVEAVEGPPCGKCRRLDFVCPNTTLPCYCPMLKPGNGVCNRLDGSILIGRKGCLGLILHPKSTFDALYARIRMSIARGGKVELVVSEPVELISDPV